MRLEISIPGGSEWRAHPPSGYLPVTKRCLPPSSCRVSTGPDETRLTTDVSQCGEERERERGKQEREREGRKRERGRRKRENCGWEWQTGQARDTPLNMPAQDTTEDQDMVMQVSSSCQTETMRTEASTVPIPKAAPIGARLDSALARQERARRAYETARRMLTMARQRMEETTKEMEQANAAVENAKRKVGPATGMASDVATLLEMLKPHLSTLSVNAADLVARIEGDMKVAKTGGENENIKEEMKNEVSGETQPTQLDKPVSDAQEIASQF